MTEDDTFRRLKRPSHREMKTIWRTSEEFTRRGITPSDEIDALFESHGWTVAEYSKESVKKYSK